MANPSAARKPSQPYRAFAPQPNSANLLEVNHEEALYHFGELGLFTLLWTAVDAEKGLVGPCQTCSGTSGSIEDRQAKAFRQPTKRECPDCFGTTYEGGFRAQIVRPVLMADRSGEVREDDRGTITRDSISFETTSDFYFHRGDYLFRADNTRYQTEEKNESVLRTGFAFPDSTDSFSGLSVAHLEEVTTVAYLIPPTSASALAMVLNHPGSFTVDDLTAMDSIRPNGYL